MVQNVERWLLDRDRFPWAREHVPQEQWFQLGKYFPGAALRKGMKYVDAATGAVVDQARHGEVPPGQVFLYGYDVAGFLGIKLEGLDTGTAGPASVGGDETG